MRAKWAVSGVLVVGMLRLLGGSLGAQEPVRSSQPDSVEVIAGQHYAVSGSRRFFFGKEYRRLWTTPLLVEVLDLGTEGGGLTPVSAGGGFQTKSLWLRGADGYMYGFRSVDKNPSDVLPPDLRETFVEDIVKDQMSSQHPGAPAVVAPLLEAAGITHTNPRLVVLPDDPRLGEHREDFAGILGFFERRATIEPGVPPFAGALEIIDSEELFAATTRSSTDRVDLATFLEARLFDYLVGDWDRHQGQWNWMRTGSDATTEWVPIPEDRDQAFARYDGVLLWLLRQYVPQLLNFGPGLPKPSAFAFNGRDLDRRFLVELEKPVWDSVVSVLVERMTDSVIEAAVRQLPPEYYALDGERMIEALKSRRGQLPERAEEYYRMLAGEVDIHATSEAETVVVERHADGSSDVSMFRGAGSTAFERPPYWHRQFDDRETEELRFYLEGGDDILVVRGDHKGIPLRIVGGGSAQVIDSSGTGRVTLYATGADRATGRVGVDRRPFVRPPKEQPEDLPPRDWGQMWRSVVWGGYGPDVGLFIGGGGFLTHYGFRKLPYASKVLVRAGIATTALTGRADLLATVYRRNSRVRGEIDLRVSGIEILRYSGLGNETDVTGSNDYYRVRQQLVFFEPTMVLPVGRGDFGLGLSLKYRNTREQDGRILADTTLYGEDGFGQVGLQGRFELDSRDTPAAATRGIYLRLGGSLFPPIWDADSLFGEVHGEISTYLSAAAIPLQPTLALRIGGKKVWGRYPFQEAAYIGDTRTVRLGWQNRYGGDASAYGNAELRLHLADVFLLLPAQFGIFGLGDVGRVFLEGETSETWHWAAGGGVWLAYLGPGNTLSLAVAKSEERVGVYAIAGFAF